MRPFEFAVVPLLVPAGCTSSPPEIRRPATTASARPAMGTGTGSGFPFERARLGSRLRMHSLRYWSR